MASSAVPVMKDRLIELFKGDDQLADVEIQYGRVANPQNEYICLQGLKPGSWTRRYINLAIDPQIDEEFEIEVLVGAYKPGQEQKEATDRDFEIFAQIERIIRAHIVSRPQDDLLMEMELRPNDQFEYAYLEGQVSVIDAAVYCHTRI